MGVAALIVAFALSNGFRDEMKDKILQGTAHLSVVRADGLPIENHVELAQRLREVNGVTTARWRGDRRDRVMQCSGELRITNKPVIG
jgi:ABC-type lipoprotein release transport system permease subunit